MVTLILTSKDHVSIIMTDANNRRIETKQARRRYELGLRLSSIRLQSGTNAAVAGKVEIFARTMKNEPKSFDCSVPTMTLQY